MLLPKFDILNKIKKERTITLEGVSKAKKHLQYKSKLATLVKYT